MFFHQQQKINYYYYFFFFIAIFFKNAILGRGREALNKKYRGIIKATPHPPPQSHP